MGPAASPTHRGLEGSTLHHDGHPYQKRARVEPPSGCAGSSSSVNFAGGSPSACGSTAASQSTLLDYTPCQNTTEKTLCTLITANPTSPNSTISIDMQAHLNRLALQTKLTEGKGTEDAYPRHIKNYENFWNAYQEGEVKKNPNHHWVNAHPIIGAKVSLFLQYESTRNKRSSSGREISGTSVGKESIKQSINALQRYMREHQHLPEYAGCPETQQLLRNQDWVKVYEQAASANEPMRVKNAHALKAKGTSADTYKKEDMIRMSNWALKAFGPSRSQVYLGLRDRALILLPTNIAFRGDSTRHLLWSDIFTQSLPMEIIGSGVEIQALVVLADQAKTNTTGRVDEHGLFWHRYPELCGFGALAFYLFGHFHVLEKKRPSFEPDFADPNHSEFGRRDWYNILLFPGKGDRDKPDGTSPMMYENHRERIHIMHIKKNISISAVTHGARFYAADKASKYGAASDQVKAMGNWKTGDPFAEVYNKGLPAKSLLASSMFSAEKPDSYCLPRGFLEPPAELLACIFPWVEEEQHAYILRVEKHGLKAIDYALRHFLDTLIILRRILLQNAAVLYSKHPECSIWNFKPFNTPAFSEFACTSVAVLETAELEAKRRLECLPETVATSMRGIVEAMEIQQNRARKDHDARFDFIESLLTNYISSKSRSRGGMRPISTNVHQCKKSLAQMPPTTTTSISPGAFALQPLPIGPQAVATNAELLYPSRPLPPPSTSIGGGNSQLNRWPSDLQGFHSSFGILSECEQERNLQLDAIRALVRKYAGKIRHHQFTWTKYGSANRPDEWLPIYLFRQGASLIEIWEEWSEGLDGCLSVRQLEEGWAARWRRGVSGQKTEMSRRRLVVQKVIEPLAAKTHWNIQLALRYLMTQYPIPSNDPPYLRTTRNFIDHLQKKTTGPAAIESILTGAASFCSH